MKLQTYRRKDEGFYTKLQDFFDNVGEAAEVEVPAIFDILSTETAQIERISFLASRKMNFNDQFNFQIVTGEEIVQDTPVVLGAKGILGQPRDVRWRSASYFAPRMWDWRPVGEQQIEVVVKWDPPPAEPVKVLFNVWGD